MFLTVPGCPAEWVEGQGPQAQWEPVGDDDLIMMMMTMMTMMMMMMMIWSPWWWRWSWWLVRVDHMIICQWQQWSTAVPIPIWKYFFSFRFWFPFSGKEQAHQYQTMYFSLLKWHFSCFVRGWFDLNGISFAQSRVSLWLVRLCLWIGILN